MGATTRRRYLGSVETTLAVSATGCSSSGPDPEVTNVELQRSLAELVDGPTTFTVEVLNNDAAGEVDVRRRRVTFGEGERCEVTVELEAPEDADSYDAAAGAV